MHPKHWYSFHWITFLLLPFSWLFRLLVAIRYWLYQFHLKKKTYFNVPVIVVGNMTVGGTGKTPFVIWLANQLQKKGYRPGIVSRGVGGKQYAQPYWVDAYSDPKEVGDEAVLLAKRAHCPMIVCIDRVAAVKTLLQKTNCNIVISDDGLQHYRLGREMEIVIVDGAREFGNGQLLPAGPLREPLGRLQKVDWIVINGNSDLRHPVLQSNTLVKMNLSGDILWSMVEPHKKISLDQLHQKTVHVVAGIGHPQRFFSALRDRHIEVIEHIFPDHYLYQRQDIYFEDDLPVIMTEKDAVKCVEFADKRHWYLPVEAQMDLTVEEMICKRLKK